MDSFEDVLQGLADHEVSETSVLYPCFLSAVGRSPVVEHCVEDHQRMARIAAHARSTRGPELVEAMRLLRDVFAAHVAFETQFVLAVLDDHARVELEHHDLDA